ncbi:hypothetical protein F2Q69_00004393 [Brassica cretica]|uniref:Uncharacterized protein n=1 Tax=Brassica cretica TaxID=69181 RepID=A0A8S9NWC7_BRACR|nr:hypothetical protein F2Q69_00004393 [Brassica cretica]
MPSYLLHKGIKFCCDLHISSTRLDSAATYFTTAKMEKRLAISTVIANAAASGGAIVVKEFIGQRGEIEQEYRNSKEVDAEELNLFDVLNSNKLVLTLAAVEFLNARSRYVLPIVSLSYEIIGRVATLDAMEKRLAISTVIASAAASGGAIVVKEFIGRNIGILRKLTQRSLNLFDVLNSNKRVLTLAAVEFLNARYGVEALVTWDEDENVRKFTT